MKTNIKRDLRVAIKDSRIKQWRHQKDQAKLNSSSYFLIFISLWEYI